MKIYVINGEPVALARARAFRGRVYDSQKHLKLVWGLDIRKQHGDEPQLVGPLFMDVIFYMPIPASLSIRKKQQMYNQWHLFKPDGDNLLKMICDICKDTIFKDDCQIAKISVEKVYDDGNGPRTEFIIKEMKDARIARKF